jgi:hypothetical protein
MKILPMKRINKGLPDLITLVKGNGENPIIPRDRLKKFQTFLQSIEQEAFVSEVVIPDTGFRNFLVTLGYPGESFTYRIEDRFGKEKKHFQTKLTGKSIGEIYDEE